MKAISDIQNPTRQLLSAVTLLLLALLVFGSSVTRHVPAGPAGEQSELRADAGAYFDDGLLPKEISAVGGASPRPGEAVSTKRNTALSSSPGEGDLRRSRMESPLIRAGQPLYCIYESYLI